MIVDVRWPDGSARCRMSLAIASERIRAKDVPCSRSAASMAGIERDAAGFAEGTVTVTGFR
jgi:hypothetical protein